MRTIGRWLVILLSSLGIAGPAAGDQSKIIADTLTAAEWTAKNLNAMGYKADFTLESLKEIERFMEDNSENGHATPGGALAEQLEPKLVGIAGYTCEVLRRELRGKWVVDDSDPDAQINIAVEYGEGTVIWPGQRVLKRFHNGDEDSIWAYAYFLTRKAEE